MGRSILAVLAGAILWGALWAGTNAGLQTMFPNIVKPMEYNGHVGMLLTLLAASVVLSLAAGYVTGLVAKTRVIQHGLALGILQLAIGIFFELSYWNLLPAWYHITFLVLLLPANVVGAAMTRSKEVEGHSGKAAMAAA